MVDVDDAIHELEEWPPKRTQRRLFTAGLIIGLIVLAIVIFNYIRISELRDDFRNEVDTRVLSICQVAKENRNKFVAYIFDLTVVDPNDTPAQQTAAALFRKNTLEHFPPITCSEKGQVHPVK